jgi:hypothetical protein
MMEAWKISVNISWPAKEGRLYVDCNDVCHCRKGCYASAKLGEESRSTNLFWLQKHKCLVLPKQERVIG